MSRTNTCSHNPYQREQPLLDYIGFLERTIISIFQKLNQSSSSIDFPSIFNDIIPELERRINNSQFFPFHGNDGIYEMMKNMLRPMMKSFLERIKEIAFESDNDAIVKKIKKKVNTYLNIKEDIEYKAAGNFLYSVGGIARKALEVSNKIYDEYIKSYEEYKKKYGISGLVYSEKNKDFPEYLKKFLNDEFYNNA